MAAKRNHVEIATLLLAHESSSASEDQDITALVEAESRCGFTPLHLAAQDGHVDMACLLLQHNANPDHQAKVGLFLRP
ncbi:unnamed protein product [Protopolystoma xenopodis]|uniref:Uncharacterized protein n=1 Tax=Protopolystoma xenopodis TaxID=117903 RepID=A0A3S5CJM3_9PLAT|nr:unnamed protein product [Protopolystoma xenopodis]